MFLEPFSPLKCIVSNQQDCHPLVQLPHSLLLLLACLASNLPPKLDERLQGLLVPATVGVHDHFFDLGKPLLMGASF